MLSLAHKLFIATFSSRITNEKIRKTGLSKRKPHWGFSVKKLSRPQTDSCPQTEPLWRPGYVRWKPYTLNL